MRILQALFFTLFAFFGVVSVYAAQAADVKIESQRAPAIKQYFENNKNQNQSATLDQHLKVNTVQMNIDAFAHMTGRKKVNDNTIYAISDNDGTAYYAVKSEDEKGREVVMLFDNKIAANFQIAVQKIKHSANRS